jgi:hypothetical protein
MTSLIEPLSIQVPIVDKNGKPTAQFQRLMQKLRLSTGLTKDSAGNVSVELPDNSVTDAELADMAHQLIKARKSAGDGDPENCTLSEVLDFIGSVARGDILFRGASGWQRLAAGSAGQVLTTGGAGADPSWATASGGSGGSKLLPFIDIDPNAASSTLASPSLVVMGDVCRSATPVSRLLLPMKTVLAGLQAIPVIYQSGDPTTTLPVGLGSTLVASGSAVSLTTANKVYSLPFTTSYTPTVDYFYFIGVVFTGATGNVATATPGGNRRQWFTTTGTLNPPPATLPSMTARAFSTCWWLA